MTADKVFDLDAAVAAVRDGDVLLVGGFGEVGVPVDLIDALVRLGRSGLTVVSNNCGTGERGVAALFKHGMVRRIVATFPVQKGNHHFTSRYERGEVELELVPQGTLAERLRAGGSGIGGFYTQTGAATILGQGREVREIGGRPYLFELPIRGNVALVRAHVADPLGNLRFRRSARNFNPVMAMAADLTIAQVERIVGVGEIDPDDVHLPGVFVDRVVPVGSLS
jgi:3-oxoadipate CoA-transferase alpha subunit